MKKRIAVKLGSAVLASGNGEINEKLIANVAWQVSEIMNDGNEVFIVTSGAVASGHKEGRSKNLKSAIGQPKLMSAYAKNFSEYGIEVSQHLFTDRELLEADNEVTKSVLLEAMATGVVPIINANDSIDSFELQKIVECADNDRLLKIVSGLVGADVVIIGFSENGFKDGSGNVVEEIRASEIGKYFEYAKGGSALGHGRNGMLTKLKMLGEMAECGIRSALVPADDGEFIIRAFYGDHGFGTKFLPDSYDEGDDWESTNHKKWMLI